MGQRVRWRWGLLGWVAILACASTIVGQSATAPVEKTPRFEVVSIRQNTVGGGEHYGRTADGFRLTNMPLMLAVLTAYVPTDGTAMFIPPRIAGTPEWLLTERYDLNAKVAEQDMPQWQNSATQTAMLRSMTKDMLTERLKLAVHREEKEVPVYWLVVGKNGPKFKETDPNQPHPGAQAVPGGATVVRDGQALRLFGITMESLAAVISSMTDRPVKDKTGLTGRYDVRLTKSAPAPSGPDESADSPWVFTSVEELGLKLQPAKANVETLVIDHVERPSAN